MNVSTQSTALAAGTWNIEPSHSNVGFAVRHIGLSKVRGRFNTFSGTVEVAEDLAASMINVSIDLGSIDTNNEQRDGHLRSSDFFDLETHPLMTFRSTNIEGGASEGRLTGDLTLNGITRAVTFKVELHGVGEDAYATTRAGFTATSELNRSDFGIDFNVPLSAGSLLIADKVSIELDIQLTPAP